MSGLSCPDAADRTFLMVVQFAADDIDAARTWAAAVVDFAKAIGSKTELVEVAPTP